MKAELWADCGPGDAFPDDGLPEVAITGRSNVGKSTLLNVLVSRHGLARTSRTPGKTRRIHFYRVADRAYLVDLPGFGYATGSREERRAWRPLVERYLRGSREALRGALLLVDARRGLQEEELQLLEWLAAERIPARLALMKSDKLPRSARESARQAAAVHLPDADLACVSARTGEGLSTLVAWIRDWTDLELRRSDGSSF